jgi:hypothetical protein
MPLIAYACTCGEIAKKYLKSAKDAASSIICAKCGLEAKKAFGTTSSSYKVTIDNGVMARKVEIDPDIMEINDERSSREYSEED